MASGGGCVWWVGREPMLFDRPGPDSETRLLSSRLDGASKMKSRKNNDGMAYHCRCRRRRTFPASGCHGSTDFPVAEDG
uniref:Uncharacterized protein n=1 Tax=Oryza punctata TaxID=4537 RepID=A0A0E0KKH0_ORYPU